MCSQTRWFSTGNCESCADRTPSEYWASHKGFQWTYAWSEGRTWPLAGTQPAGLWPRFVVPGLLPWDSCTGLLFLPLALNSAASHFPMELFNGGKPGGTPIVLCLPALFARGGISGDLFSTLISFWCALHCTIYPWSDQFFLDRFRIASPKDGAADIGQRFIFSHNYGEDLQCTITYQVYIKPAIIPGEPFNKTQGFRLGLILTFQWNIIT